MSVYAVLHQEFEGRSAVLMTVEDKDAAEAAALWFWCRGIRAAVIPAARADRWRRRPTRLPPGARALAATSGARAVPRPPQPRESKGEAAEMDADFSKLIRAKGECVVDRDGNQIAEVAQVASEPKTLAPRWLVVRTSVVGRSRLVPIDGAVDDGQVVRVPFSKETVMASPVPAVAIAPAITECTALDEHYHRAA